MPSQYSTVQAAINAANPNDVIEVAPGTYVGDVDFLGKISFQSLSADRTNVTVEMEYHAPYGRIGEALAKMLHEDPCVDLPKELENFKQFVESGENAASA